MNNPGARHLEEGELLRLIDGELPDDAVSSARAHIEACWTCRAQFQEIETAIGEYVRYQKTIDPLLPPPPNSWPELRFDSAPAIGKPEPPRLLIMPRRRWFDLRWAIAAAAVLVAILAGYRLQRAPEVRAESLLRKAAAAETVGGSIRIRTGSRTLMRPAVLQGHAAGDDAQLRERFERTHFNWEQPLSARAFGAWRDQLSDKQDDVRIEGEAYIVRTSTHSSELHQATMTLRMRDLRPVREMLEFTGQTVEVEEVPEQDTTANRPPAAPAQAAPHVTSPAKAASALHRLLQVFSTLHRLGADLGEPVEISQNATGVEVAAIGLSQDRQRQLREAFENIPDVVIRFDAGASHAAPIREEQTKNQPTAPSPAQTRLQELLGSVQAAENLTDRALDSSDAVLARVHALRAIAKAFPPPQEAALTVDDGRLLTDLRRDHTTALMQRIAELRSALQPVIGNAPGEPATTTAAGSWQQSVEQLFIVARQMDETLNSELAGATSDGNGFTQIATALNALDRQARSVATHP
jgi:PAS domain-containing protein